MAREVAELRLSAAVLAEVGRLEQSAELVQQAETIEECLNM